MFKGFNFVNNHFGGKRKMKNFMKKYGYYLMAFVLILIVGLSVGLGGEKQKDVPTTPADNSQTEPVNTTPIEMVSPLNNAEVLKWFSDTELFYNSTLKQWESHKGVDLVSENTDVYSVLDGVVTDCTYSYADGYCVTIRHDDGLVTKYCSLANLDGVTKGSSVSRGQKIGETSTSASNESAEGGHLHFVVLLNGSPVDPSNYLSFENK